MNLSEGVYFGMLLKQSYTELPNKFYTKQTAAPFQQPEMFIFNDALAQELGIQKGFKETEHASDFLAGQLPEYYPQSLAQAYAGHQFGHFTMLGDGRAILLGEQTTALGGTVDIQLKGSGRTAYSRGGDGKAALGPMLREYLISEAMYELGIPTTRSLSVVKTGENVIREQMLPGAILVRVASSHLRVGTFEYAARWGSKEDIRALADYAITKHYPQAQQADNPYLRLLELVIAKQAKLIASWQLIGFIHGVMNTDNMTISGETIDYGPCAFMNHFDPETVFSSIDREGRYAYQNQPYIGGWNLSRLAEVLIDIIDESSEEAKKLAQQALDSYADQYYLYWQVGMGKKLGLTQVGNEDEELFHTLLQFMYDEELDYTNTFVDLTLQNFVRIDAYQKQEFQQWKQKWLHRLAQEQKSKEEIEKVMRHANPIVIPRNDWVEQALSEAVANNSQEPILQLLELLKSPYDYTEQQRLKYIEPINVNINYRTFCGT